MRFMILRKADQNTEAGIMPDETLFFGPEFTPELREAEERLRAQVATKEGR
jgi:hypothetical protein